METLSIAIIKITGLNAKRNFQSFAKLRIDLSEKRFYRRGTIGEAEARCVWMTHARVSSRARFLRYPHRTSEIAAAAAFLGGLGERDPRVHVPRLGSKSIGMSAPWNGRDPARSRDDMRECRLAKYAASLSLLITKTAVSREG